MRGNEKSQTAHTLTRTYTENNDTASAARNEQGGTNVMWLQEAHEEALKQAPRQEGARRDGMQMYTQGTVGPQTAQ